MRNLLLFLATIPLLFSRPPSAALAEGPLLDLSGSLTVLRLGQSPFAFSGITVRSGAELRIEPGVIINLSADGKVEISGSLESLGTATQPIIFQSKKHEVWDSFLCSSTAQKCAIAHTYFKDFRNGLTIRSSETTLSDISLIDGVRNVLEIESQKKDFLKIMNVSFLNRGRGREMEEMQLKINGPIQLVEANSISFINGASKERIPWAKTGITLNGATGAHFIASSFPYKCRPTGSREGSSLLLRADIKYCTAPEVPTIFVPGYGTSINLSQLVKAPTAEASREGWRFIDLINPEYGDFLETLKASSVPHEIAYYDWRLPAELASQLYLEPFIEKVKAKYGSQTVNLVTHSFGGIVGRSYISSDRYKGDVAKIIQVAPPNQGAAKAYSAWQGGILPPDWQPLMHLVRFYSYWFKRPHDPDYQIIRTFFPSAKDLLPIYPSLLHSGQVLDPSLLTERNQTLLDLSERTFLFKRRVSPIVFAGNSIQTLTGLHLSPGSGKELWPDGQPLQEVFDNGDATVPVLSSVLPEEETFFWPAGHSEIIKVVAEETVETLYPGKKAVTAPEKPRPSPLSFLFDCPISVSITFPNGIMRSSEEPDGNPEKGEVFSSPELLWMVVPKMLGEYTIQIKARETTEVRWWVENGDIHTFHMEEGEEATLFYRHEETAKPTPFLGLQEASPAPQLSLHSATPTPSPPKKYVPYKIALDSKPTNPSEPVSPPVPEEKPHEESTNNLHFLLVAWATGGTLLILASLFALKKKGKHKL